MKMFTAAAALEEGVVGLNTPIQDSKTLVIGDNVVRNFDKKSVGLMPFEDKIAHSRNVATGKVALMLGDTTDEASQSLYDMWWRLGIGQPTGIELGNESAGIVPIRPIRRGTRSTSSTVRSARRWRSRPCSWCVPSRQW